MNVVNTGSPVRLSASGLIRTIPGNLIGVIVNATSAGTITLYDDNAGANGTAFVAAIAPAAGAYVAIPASLSKGLYFVKGGTSIDCTFFIAD